MALDQRALRRHRRVVHVGDSCTACGLPMDSTATATISDPA
jgi:hypothetical protein